jgi:hypothetical protein
MLGALWPALQSWAANRLSVLRISLAVPRSRRSSVHSMIHNGRVVREVASIWLENARNGHRIVAVFIRQHAWIGIEGEVFGHFVGAPGNGVIPCDDLTAVGGHAAQDGRHAAGGAKPSLIVLVAAADRRHQVVVFLLVTTDVLSRILPGIPSGDAAARAGHAVGAVGKGTRLTPAALDMTALAEHLGPVCVRELIEMVVEDLAVIFPLADLAAAHAVGLNRMAAFDPIGLID